MKAGGLAVAAAVAALALPSAAFGAQSVTITDVAGDANGLAAAGLNVATAPASDASRDITSVTLTRERSEYVLRLALSAAPDVAGPQTFALLRGAMGDCEAYFGIGWGVLGPMGESGPLALSGVRQCDASGFLFSVEGYTATVDGNAIVARFPFAALARNRSAISPTAALRDLQADIRVGTYAFGTHGSFRCDDSGCSQHGPNYSFEEFVGPFVDTTAKGGSLTAVNATAKKRVGRLARR